MKRVLLVSALLLLGGQVFPNPALGQSKSSSYIGFVYPAGAQRGTTTRIRLGGQRIDGVYGAVVSGSGVTAKLVEYQRKLGNQEMQLLREELRLLKKSKKKTPAMTRIMARIQARLDNYCNRPACAALSSLAFVDVTIAADAPVGAREIRLLTARGVTNPMVFHVGQLREVTRPAMKTAPLQVLGKEYLALPKRAPGEAESDVIIPCTMNGQIASGQIDRYRFDAKKGQHLVVIVRARELIPYIADAVPGWFQPVIALYDDHGREVAFDDDYRFKPDPVLYYEVPADGQYTLAISDAIYRGREDFVYRISVGELPFITSMFPLGGPVGTSVDVEIAGWNLTQRHLAVANNGPNAGVVPITSRAGRYVSNPVPFRRDTLREVLDREPNDSRQSPQPVKMPVIINGRMDRPDDVDVFRFQGKAGQKIVAEVMARRLDAPVDSFLKITDHSGRIIAFNDDHEDPGSGLNTHHADSYLMTTLPADGVYCVHLNDTAGNGGDAYAYRLRISPPRPDFALRVVPSSVVLRSRSGAALAVHALRKDGFAGPITVSLRNPPNGVTLRSVTLPAGKDQVNVRVQMTRRRVTGLFPLTVQGQAKVGKKSVAHDGVAAEDRMQAFLWRHLVPAQELAGFVYDPSLNSTQKRVHPPTRTKQPIAKVDPTKLKFTKRQVASRLRQLELLYQEGLLTDAFYDAKVAECDAVK